jgi:Na+-driven multidrug efflux pump
VPESLTTRRIAYYWLPLFASWLLMTAEGPMLSAVVNRMPDEVVMLAALGIVYALAFTLESPIVQLLATSTALVRDRPSFEVTRRFTLHGMALMTLIGVLLGFGPLFAPVVERLLGTPPEIARWVRPGLQIMVLWAPAIAWRRFLQGVLIRFGRPRAIAAGTVLRLLSTVGTALTLASRTQLPGIHVFSWSLMAGVLVEALYVTWVARPVVAALPGEAVRPLAYGRLLCFHLPLAGTAVLTLIGQPLVTFVLARLAQPTLNLAAWPLVYQALLLLRAAALSLPEVVIALADQDGAADALKRFAGRLATGIGLFTAVLVLTPLLRLYLFGVQDADPVVAERAWLGLVLSLPLPAGAVVICWLQGLLIHREQTATVNVSTAVQLAVLALGLGAALVFEAPGLPAAVIALQASMIAQAAFMVRRLRSGSPMPT